jgi:hypothetical protein
MLRIDGPKPAYTLREILECNYPELLETAESGCAILTKLQNALIELLPLSQRLLPSNSSLLANVEAQANLTTFIFHYSLFAFADKAYTMLKEQCTALAEALNSNNYEEEEKLADNLKKTLNALSRIPFDNLLDHGAAGLHRLDTFKDYLQENLDFLVIPVLKANGSLRSNWSFRDITGTIMRHGLSYEPLLTNCIDAPLPKNTTISELVDNEKMVRIY